MKKLRVSYEIIGVREASLDSFIDEQPSFNLSTEFEKFKKASLSLATFSIFMVSFNITTPLTISTGVTSFSVGNLTLFFILLLVYQIYILKCLRDEFSLLVERNIGSSKQDYCFYLLCRRAAMMFKEYDLVKSNSDIEFTMRGIPIGKKMHHAPAIVFEFETNEQLELWRSKLSTDFSIENMHNNKYWIFLNESTVSEGDIRFWHENKKRLYRKLKPVHNHYYIPMFYSMFGLCTTILMIFPTFREWIVSLFYIVK